jgi:tRNA (cmo5U34)-methyltransferase
MKYRDNITSHKSNLYDTQIEDTIPYNSYFHQETINLIKSLPNEPKTWLDTGCGTGSLVKKASEVFPNTKFLLSDPSKEMLNQSRKKLSDVSKDRLIFLKPSPTQEFPHKLEEKMDIITAIQCHHYLSSQDRIKATKICYDLLKEDGIYITFENIRPLTQKGVEIGKRYWKDFQLSRGRDPEIVEKHLMRFNMEYFPITIEEHLSLLREIGFEVIELLWFSYMQAGFYCQK